MSFNIIQGDITQVNTDAVVLPANPQLLRGPGSSQAVFSAAGIEELEAACKEIGYCPLGDAVITPAFNLKAKNIIHAVCPRYIDGTHKESELLRRAYMSAMRLASNNGLKSIAFPLLSAGNYHFPKGEALDIANTAIRDYLEEIDDEIFDVILVIYDRENLRAQSRYFDEATYQLMRGYTYEDRLMCCSEAEFQSAAPERIIRKDSFDELIIHKQQDFATLLNEYIIKSEMTNPQVYNKAMISKQVFSKAISGQTMPKKSTILALAVALELSLPNTRKLLMKAGYALSDADPTDIIVEYFIRKKKYDVMLINETLFLQDLPLLGNVAF